MKPLLRRSLAEKVLISLLHPNSVWENRIPKILCPMFSSRKPFYIYIFKLHYAVLSCSTWFEGVQFRPARVLRLNGGLQISTHDAVQYTRVHKICNGIQVSVIWRFTEHCTSINPFEYLIHPSFISMTKIRLNFWGRSPWRLRRKDMLISKKILCMIRLQWIL